MTTIYDHTAELRDKREAAEDDVIWAEQLLRNAHARLRAAEAALAQAKAADDA